MKMNEYTIELYDRENDSYWGFVTIADCEEDAMDNLNKSRFKSLEVVGVEVDE